MKRETLKLINYKPVNTGVKNRFAQNRVLSVFYTLRHISTSVFSRFFYTIYCVKSLFFGGLTARYSF